MDAARSWPLSSVRIVRHLPQPDDTVRFKLGTVPRVRRENRGRSAAATNRTALLGAARQQFDSDGFDASLSAIARRAGVGQGSLYRHFPDRVSLAIAVFTENVAELEALAASPTVTLSDVLALITEQTIASMAFIDMLHASDEDDRLRHIIARVTVVLDRALSAAQRAGTARAGVTAADAFLAVQMVAALLAKTPAESRREVAEHAWTLLSPSIRTE
jgi:AcrR family transcriptional regulator